MIKTYFSFIDLVAPFGGKILFTWSRTSHHKRFGQTNGDFGARDNNNGQWVEIHYDEQNNKICSPEIPALSIQFIKPIRAGFP